MPILNQAYHWPPYPPFLWASIWHMLMPKHMPGICHMLRPQGLMNASPTLYCWATTPGTEVVLSEKGLEPNPEHRPPCHPDWGGLKWAHLGMLWLMSGQTCAQLYVHRQSSASEFAWEGHNEPGLTVPKEARFAPCTAISLCNYLSLCAISYSDILWSWTKLKSHLKRWFG